MHKKRDKARDKWEEQVSDALYEVGRAVDRCWAALVRDMPEDRPSLLKTFHDLCKELQYLESIHSKIRRLRRVELLRTHLVMMKLEGDDPAARRQLKREFASAFELDSPVPFKLQGPKPQEYLTKERLVKGQELALEVGGGVIALDESIRQYLKSSGYADMGPRWPDYLDELTSLYDRPLLDCLQPPSKGAKPRREQIAREVLSILKEARESGGSIALSYELRHMAPPLTWGEVVYHFLRDPESTKGETGKALREYLRLFRKRSCLECGKLFPVSKSSLNLLCNSCSARLRQRNHRKGKVD